MPGRVVLFGATGYTGDLTARAMVARGMAPLLAGRNAERLAQLAGELGGLETRVADVARPETVRALVERGDVLVTTVGPFARFGRPALEAAVDAGAHYVDSTGEAPFIREVFERWGRAAQTAGAGLLTAMGYDFVPGNLAAGVALREAGDAATAVEVGYFARGIGPSGGTRASAAGIVLDPAYSRRGGRLVEERPAARVRSFELGDGREAAAVSIGASEQLALPRIHPGLSDVGVYLGWFAGASRAMSAMSLGLSAAARVPGVRPALRALAAKAVPGSTGGPGPERRARSSSAIVARALDARGDRLAQVRLEGIDPYDFTGRMLAWAAERAAAGDLRGSGALGPVDGFGLDRLEAGVAEAGISRA